MSSTGAEGGYAPAEAIEVIGKIAFNTVQENLRRGPARRKVQKAKSS
jgi:hypothetical protein